MAITPNYSWPLPDDDSLVKDGAEAIRDLGNAIDTTVDGLPSGGKILQVVRATDSTNRSTTSTTFVDASLSVTITPQRSNSAILLISFFAVRITKATSGNMFGFFQITDNSNNAISGAQEIQFGLVNTANNQNDTGQTLIAYDTPATTSAVTYKVRFKSIAADTNVDIFNAARSTGQFYAIEVAA